MRTLLSMVLLSAVMFSCGDTGVAFNVSKELPVTVPFAVPIPSTPAELDDLLNVNPPSETLEYEMDQVGVFSDYLKDIQSGDGDLVFNSLSYQIDGVDATEQNIELDEMVLGMTIGSAQIEILSVVGNLTNTPKTEIPLTQQQLDNIKSELLANGGVTSTILFDLASVPAGLAEMGFDFTLHFDATLKVRQGTFGL